MPCRSSNMPVSAATRASCLARIRPRASPASTCGSRSPAISALIMSCADRVVSLLATDETLIRAFEQFLQPLPAAGPVPDQVGAGPGEVPQLADRPRRHEAGPQQPPLGQPGQPD